jgi:ABC-type uncharacterized transport system YnjBCD permease subunit
MSSTIVMTILALALMGTVIAYLWPRPEVRFEKLFVSTLGALVGSLIGRVASDPGWTGHLLYVAMGAFAFSGLDWIIRSRRKYSNPR